MNEKINENLKPPMSEIEAKLNNLDIQNVINCTTCWWNKKREVQAPCAYCGSSYGVYNQHKPNK